MSLVAGLDWSTFALDFVLLDEDVDLASHHRRRLDLGGGDGTTRIRRIRQVMPPASWWTDNTVAVGIEKPFSRGHGKGSDVMGMALGAILACLPVEHPVVMLRADDWRRALDLPTRAARDVHKANSKRFAVEHWPDRPAVIDDNASDAFCIAYATRLLLEAKAAAA